MKRIAARASLQLGAQGAFLAASGYVGMLMLVWYLGPEAFGLYGVIIVTGGVERARDWHTRQRRPPS